MTTKDVRIEHDSMGEVEIPEAPTTAFRRCERSGTSRSAASEPIRLSCQARVHLKRAAAEVNRDLGIPRSSRTQSSSPPTRFSKADI